MSAVGLILGSWLANSVLSGRFSSAHIVRYAIYFGFFFSLLFFVACILRSNVFLLLSFLFFMIVALGVIFPVTTQLALQPFKQNSG